MFQQSAFKSNQRSLVLFSVIDRYLYYKRELTDMEEENRDTADVKDPKRYIRYAIILYHIFLSGLNYFLFGV